MEQVCDKPRNSATLGREQNIRFQTVCNNPAQVTPMVHVQTLTAVAAAACLTYTPSHALMRPTPTKPCKMHTIHMRRDSRPQVDARLRDTAKGAKQQSSCTEHAWRQADRACKAGNRNVQSSILIRRLKSCVGRNSKHT
jgi:hypothetical protein